LTYTFVLLAVAAAQGHQGHRDDHDENGHGRTTDDQKISVGATWPAAPAGMLPLLAAVVTTVVTHLAHER
jgi:hypothetical protein